MNTPQKARKFYNNFEEYESFQQSENWYVPELLVGGLTPYISGGEKIIDIGCGPGMVGIALEKYRWRGSLIGVDIAENRLKEASEKSCYSHCVQADAHYLPFADNVFDIVISSAMVGLTGISSVQEMIRILKPGRLLACAAGEIKNKCWCRQRFQEVISFFNDESNTQILTCKDLGSGCSVKYNNEHYVYYLIRKN